MIRVALTRYPGPPQNGEVTVWTDMPQVPSVGDSVSLGDPEIPTEYVRHVAWVASQGSDGGLVWHAEISVGVRPI